MLASATAAPGDLPGDSLSVSPCVNVCTLDAASGLCLGCRRTLEEISAWSAASNDERRQIIAAAARRTPAPT